MLAFAAGAGIVFAMAHGARMHRLANNSQSGSTASGSAADDEKDDKDDPNQIDTIVLGDPSEAPAPARKGNHVSPVHPTIVIVLPRDGKDFGLIPDSPAGRLLFAWLAAFNQASGPALSGALPTSTPAATIAAQLALRQQTGGFNLLSAKEIQPGLLVFRLRDQTTLGGEALGTLEVTPDTIPATIESFSLSGIPPPPAPDPAAAPN